jgi:hypothetical protein
MGPIAARRLKNEWDGALHANLMAISGIPHTRTDYSCPYRKGLVSFGARQNPASLASGIESQDSYLGRRQARPSDYQQPQFFDKVKINRTP